MSANDISSAEITATFRSAIPALSGDDLSVKLASEAGKQLAQDFISKYDYPLVTRKISVSSGYILLEAKRLLLTGKFDSCISFASGFSLLTYLIAKSIGTDIQYFDTDFPHMIEERNKRINKIKYEFKPTILKRVQTKAFDIEQSFEQRFNLKDIFPNCKRPLFIADGVSYFLSKHCTAWLLEQMGAYEQSAVILYYWPDDMLEKSSLFASVYEDLNKGMILEELKGFWDETTLAQVKQQFPYIADWSIAEVDNAISSTRNPPLIPQLTDENNYFPIRMLTAQKFAMPAELLHLPF